MNDLSSIRKKYDLPRMFSMAVSGAFTNAGTHESGFITLYEDALAAGLRLPLYSLAQDFLIYLGIRSGAITMNSWWFLMGRSTFGPRPLGTSYPCRSSYGPTDHSP